MSWSLNIVLDHESTDDGLEKEWNSLKQAAIFPVGQNSDVEKERDQQVSLAIEAVMDILSENPIWSEAKEITVSLSGHANKDHKKDSAWSNEFINIAVYVKSYREE